MESLRDVLVRADRERIAIGHFNFSELAAFNAIIAAAQELRAPVMVGVSEGERAYVRVAPAAALVRSVRESYGLPLYLNADHTHFIEKTEQAARADSRELQLLLALRTSPCPRGQQGRKCLVPPCAPTIGRQAAAGWTPRSWRIQPRSHAQRFCPPFLAGTAVTWTRPPASSTSAD